LFTGRIDAGSHWLKMAVGVFLLSLGFIAFAIGGQKLLRKVAPSIAEKDSE
jgi:hypothetical protein